MHQILLATGNMHKAKELRYIFSEYEVLTLKDIGFNGDIVEDGSSFEENALIKARFLHKKIGKTVIADDSGLCVDALNGQPGIYSARYAGEPCNDKNNNEKLLKAMQNVEEENRTAVFMCAAAVVFSDGSEYCETGKVSGKIGFEEIGEFGFGYDPLFICDENNKRYAQMNDDEKNQLSHRKRAFEKLKPFIDDYFGVKK